MSRGKATFNLRSTFPAAHGVTVDPAEQAGVQRTDAGGVRAEHYYSSSPRSGS